MVRRLVAQGDRVVALVRDPARATELAQNGVSVVRDDLTDADVIAQAMREVDAAIHIAGRYRVGIPVAERPDMLAANVGATNHMLDASASAGLARLVHVSTINVFGDTHGRIVDETYRRDLGAGFLSYYDETKYLAHQAVEERIRAGAPIVIAMPGVVYGPRDHSAIGAQLQAAHDGTLAYQTLGGSGISAVHVDDVAAGIVAALDRGRTGESYLFAGDNVRLRDALATAARVGGHTLPRLHIPDAAVRIGSFAPEWLARAVGLPDNLREVQRASLGVSYWASSAKAVAELGYAPRDLASGICAAFGSA